MPLAHYKLILKLVFKKIWAAMARKKDSDESDGRKSVMETTAWIGFVLMGIENQQIRFLLITQYGYLLSSKYT